MTWLGRAALAPYPVRGRRLQLRPLAVRPGRPLTALQRHPDYPVLRQALLAGYRRHHPLAPEHEALLPAFLALRGIQDVIGVIQDREHPKFRENWREILACEIQALRHHVLGEGDRS
jgi:hypothetical protein